MEKSKKTIFGKIFGAAKDGDEAKQFKKCLPCGAVNPVDAKFCYACGSLFPVIYDSYDAFISYRRDTGSDLASLLKIQLENNYHKKIFLDIKELQVGRFDEALLRRIEETPNFILILSKSSLDRCKEKSDWLKREVMHALATKRNIITILNKDFDFPSEDLWELLPKEMRVLSSLNGIKYDHIHQDSDIRTVASYMKTEKEVPSVSLTPEIEESTIPVRTTTVPGGQIPPVTTDSAPGGQVPPVRTTTDTGGQVPPARPAQGQSQPGAAGQAKPLSEPRPGQAGANGQSEMQYIPVSGVIIKDETGSETVLTEFGIRSDSGAPSLEASNRDDIYITLGQGSKAIKWGQIDYVEIRGRDDATIKLSDGNSIDHVKLAQTRIVGKNREDFAFSFDFSKQLTIKTLRDPIPTGRDELLNTILILAKRACPQANRWTLSIRPEGEGVSVTADNYFYNDIQHTHSFLMPGKYKFLVQGKGVSFKVSQVNGENFTMYDYPLEVATALAIALTRLNSMLENEKNCAGGKETPVAPGQESFIILKRGEYLTAGTRDSKNRSVYLGPGTVLEVKEKGKGKVYQWYRFIGADDIDYWYEGPGPIDTVDRRCFFRIDETGQVGYMAEILGERDEPWGSCEIFKIDDDNVGPTEVKIHQIDSMTALNGQMSLKKSSGAFTGKLVELGNFKYGSQTKGPCLVTPDAVIPLVRSNRAGSISVSRIPESEKPRLAPASIYGSKTQIKFILNANSSEGYFDDSTSDIYMQLNEQSLGWIRIYIPSIVRILVDPGCKEAPVTVETTEERTYKGICPDPFNLAGSAFTFSNARKAMVLNATEGKHGINNPVSWSGNPEEISEQDDQKVSKPGVEVMAGEDTAESSWIMKTTNGPGERADFGMIYDYRSEMILLHGGFGKGNADNHHIIPGISALRPEQNDSWTWDGESWRLSTSGTLSLVSHAMAHDRKRGQNVILGGWTGSQRIKGTFILVKDNWIPADAGNAFETGGFQNHALAFDEKRNTVLLFGGLTISIPGGQRALGETLEWNGTVWRRLHVDSPEPRWGHKMIYDQDSGVIVLFGGTDGKSFFNDTWTWEGHTATWKKVASEISPSARTHHGMLYDALKNRVLLIGGMSADKLPLGDLWEWNGKEWILLMNQVPPKPRYNHGFAYDEKRNKSILYGGTDGIVTFCDTWEFGS